MAQEHGTLAQEFVISRDPEVMNGTLVFAGTRVPVKALIDELAAGRTIDEFRDGYPRVKREQLVELLQHIGVLLETTTI